MPISHFDSVHHQVLVKLHYTVTFENVTLGFNMFLLQYNVTLFSFDITV